MVTLFLAVAASLLSASTINASPVGLGSLLKRGSGKAGISWPIQEHSVAPVPQLFGGSALTWWYDWNKNHGTQLFYDDPAEVSVSAEFVPMFFNPSFVTDGAPLEAGWTKIMGFNEPGKYQNGVSAGDAAASWKQLVGQARSETPWVELWSPVVAADKQWLSDFFGAICPGGLNGCEFAPQYLNVHAYTTDVQAFQGIVSSYHDQFGLDVVVSEFACTQFGSSAAVSPEQASQFMRGTTAWLDATPWVHKYAWFGAMRNAAWLYGVSPSNLLMNPDGSLTDLGRQYVGGGQ